MAAKKKPAPTALAVLDHASLATEAKSLEVVVQVDPQKLREEVEALTGGSNVLAMEIAGVEVSDEETLAEAVRLRNDAGRREKGLADIWKRYKEPLNAARAVVLDMESKTVLYFSGLKEEANRKINEHIAAQLRAKQEADAAFERAAAADRRATAARAQALMQQGFVRQAHVVEAQLESIVTPTLPEPDIKVPGNRVVEGYKGTCTDVEALLREIGAGRFPLLHDVKGVMRPIVLVDQVVINAIVSRHLSATKIPGVEISTTVGSSGVKY